uniref:Putative LAGLIDADG homing endonuclease n=1 Tax=Coleochaete scutata TaxID=3125 RepID=A0A5P9NVY1_COLSC|nr:putative LAGLIDADG homing endonuclease [Coleochaete scutata]QFU80112.1 putative LAGLIDADG homing endonuclease [Coleochaete scutata]
MPIGYRILPVAAFSQKNILTLNAVGETLTQYNIVWRIQYQNYRGSEIKIEGLENVRKFVNLLDNLETKMYGLKFFDLCIMKQLYFVIDENKHNTVEGRQQVIDLKFSLHTGPFEYQAEANGRLGRDIWEERHGIVVGSSIGTARKTEIYKQYEEHIKKTKLAMKKSQLQLNPSYISGLIEGDGCLCSFIIRQNGFCIPRFQNAFSFTIEKEGVFLLDVIAYYFKDNRPYFYKQPNAISYTIRRPEIHQNLIDHFNHAPVFGSLPQIEMFKTIHGIKARKLDYAEAVKLATMIYEKSSRNGRKKKSLEEVIEDFKKYFKA